MVIQFIIIIIIKSHWQQRVLGLSLSLSLSHTHTHTHTHTHHLFLSSIARRCPQSVDEWKALLVDQLLVRPCLIWPTVVECDPISPFSIAIIPRCKKVLLHSLDCPTLLLIRFLKCWVSTKEASSTVFLSPLVWLVWGLNLSLLDHWRTSIISPSFSLFLSLVWFDLKLNTSLPGHWWTFYH